MSDYLILYDITDPKRLAKTAKYLTTRAFRVQYSVFLLQSPTKRELDALTARLRELIDATCDDLRIYRIKNHGYRAGCATDLRDPFIIT